MSNTVVWYDSAETGAPTLNNAAGSLDAVLYACLVTGFRVLTLDSVTVAAGVATATYAAGHGYGDERVLEIAGASTGAINGRKLITVTGAATFTFPAPGVSDGAVAGSITAKRAPLGWARPLSSGNVSIYTRTDVTATGMALRVDDSGSGAAGSSFARARMLESYTGLNAFTNPSPPAAQLGGAGVYWTKRNHPDPQAWVLIGDGRCFYLMTPADNYYPPTYNGLQGVWGFGDLAPYRAGDAYSCILSGSMDSGGANGQMVGYAGGLSSAPGSWSMCLPRGYAGVGAPLRCMPVVMGVGGGMFGAAGPVFPNPVDNGVLVIPSIPVTEDNGALNYPIRGALRGVGAPAALMSGGQLHLQVLDNLVGSDRRWLFVSVGQFSSFGHVAFDITGPW